jgi:hypothetical protein
MTLSMAVVAQALFLAYLFNWFQSVFQFTRIHKPGA